MQIVSAGENGISKSVAGSIISGSTSCCSSSSSFSSLFLTPRTLRLAVLIILAAAVLSRRGRLLGDNRRHVDRAVSRING
ncbi:WSSV540 [White spot syndrome virus]|uniref:WSSV540 n=1 Tax=White spot syndrome virus TaxID=342409 RepID=A0A2I6SCH6_9VIRU|nr:WSSV540 [White spot syndrome virus]